MFPTEYQSATLQALSDAPLEHSAPPPARVGSKTVALYEWFRSLPAPERLGRLVRAVRDAIAREKSDPCGCAEALGAIIGVITGSVSNKAMRKKRSAADHAKDLLAHGEARETAIATVWLAFLVAELSSGDCVYGSYDPWCGPAWYCLCALERSYGYANGWSSWLSDRPHREQFARTI